jgi:hypothetical protein
VERLLPLEHSSREFAQVNLATAGGHFISWVLATARGHSSIDFLSSGYIHRSSGQHFGNTMILAAFPEFYAILSLIAAILMMPLLKL